MDGSCSTHGERTECNLLEARYILGDLVGCKGNIKMDLRESGFERVYWIQLAQNSTQWYGQHSDELLGSVKQRND